MITDPPHVLIIDDDPDMCEVTHDYLTAHGCPVVQATSVTQALTRLADAPPDVILLDIGLPDIPGTDLFAHIQTQCPDVAVIFITALNEGELAAEMVRRGARRTERPHIIWSSRSR